MQATVTTSGHQFHDDGSWSFTWEVHSTPKRLVTWKVRTAGLTFRPARATSTTRPFTASAKVPAGVANASLSADVTWSDGTSATVSGQATRPA